ncbi:hypothetical protein CONLIGDRAFT_437534 [Coniochaeta ligniaria NRRL 30616]|uniref:Uncharacterized protein n=1 Tax=Coniochaeta ligniaria NRRL 30616 TaxID=1408157 RepID=A0A1J7IJJ6_9PEZI|nr:hypothetical protein CONLIGDRAFT_437534 [Coniochaeta ligniaria NRRL 30616]
MCGIKAEGLQAEPPNHGAETAEERATIRKDGRTSQLEEVRDSLTHTVSEQFETMSTFSTGKQDGTATKAGMLAWAPHSATLAAPLSPRGKLCGSQDLYLGLSADCNCTKGLHTRRAGVDHGPSPRAHGGSAASLEIGTDWLHPATRIVLVGLRLPHFLLFLSPGIPSHTRFPSPY